MINGSGTLNVTGNYKDGINSRDGLKLCGGIINVNAIEDGIIGKDYLDSDGTVALTAEREGSDSGLGELTGIRVVPEEEYITVNTGFVS